MNNSSVDDWLQNRGVVSVYDPPSALFDARADFERTALERHEAAQRPWETNVVGSRHGNNTALDWAMGDSNQPWSTSERGDGVWSLAGNFVPLSEFGHNNQVPFYRGAEPPGHAGMTRSLEMFSGASEDMPELKEKVAQKPLFAPAHNTGVYNEAADLAAEEAARTRYIPSRMQQGVLPFKQVRVAPGIGLGYTTTGHTGFDYDSRDSLHFKTVDELRLKGNAKVSLAAVPGAPSAMNKSGAAVDISGELTQRGAPRVFETPVEDLIPGRAGNSRQVPRSAVPERHTAREDVGYRPQFGPAWSKLVSNDQWRDVHMAGPKREPLLRSTGLGAAYRPDKAPIGDHGRSGTQVPDTQRGIHDDKEFGLISSLVSAVKSAYAPVLDILPATRKQELYEHGRHEGGNPHALVARPVAIDPEARARTTLKETNIHNTHEGHVGAEQGRGSIVIDPEARARTTLKETTIHNTHEGHVGAEQGRGAIVIDPEARARTTLKETTIHNTHEGHVGAEQGRGTIVIDPEARARTTLKETNIHNTREGHVGAEQGRGTIVIDPEARTRTTLKETTIHNTHEGHVGTEQGRGAIVIDPEARTRTTLKETNIHNTHEGHVGAEQGRGAIVIDPEARTRTTLKETNIHNTHEGHVGQTTRRQFVVHASAVPLATTKELLLDVDSEKSRNVAPGHTRAMMDRAREDKAKRTMREVNPDNDYVAPVQQSSGGANAVRIPHKARPTQREITSDSPYTGASGGGKAGAMGAYTILDATPDPTQRDLTGEDERTGPVAPAARGSAATAPVLVQEPCDKKSQVVDMQHRAPTNSGPKRALSAAEAAPLPPTARTAAPERLSPADDDHAVVERATVSAPYACALAAQRTREPRTGRDESEIVHAVQQHVEDMASKSASGTGSYVFLDEEDGDKGENKAQNETKLPNLAKREKLTLS